ncbi:MAG: DNA primase [Planctomycetota bacterium]
MARYILDEKVEEVRAASDIVSVIGQYVPLKKAGRNFVARCPFHREKTPSFNVNPERQIFKCFGCNEAGNVFTFVMKHERLSFPQAVEILAERAGIVLRRGAESGPREGGGSRERLREVNVWAARRFRKWLESAEGKEARDYLERRRIEEKTVRRFGLGWAPDQWDALLSSAQGEGIADAELRAAGLVIEREAGGGFYDRFRGRLIFPIIEPSGRVIAFGGRTLADATPKYINSPETAVFSKGRSLYGLYHSKGALRQERRVLVVEGYMDCIALVQAGVENVVATLGTALTIEHLRTLRRYADEVIVIFDGDEAGQRAAERVLALFVREDVEVLVALLPEGEDPCDFVQSRGAEAFRELVKNAVSALDFRLRRALGGARSLSVTAKRRAVEEVLEIVAETPDELKRTLLIQRVAAAAGVSAEVLARDAARIRRNEGPKPKGGSGGEEVALPGPEKELFHAVFADETLMEEVMAEGPEPEELEPEGARELYECAREHFRARGEFSTAAFLAGLSEPGTAQLGAALAAEGGTFDARAMLRSSLAAFEDRRLERRVREIERAIDAASAAGDEEESKRLMAELQAQLADRARRRVRPQESPRGQLVGRS